MKQYDIWWADLPDPMGTRPVLLLSRSAACEYLNRLIVVEVTSRVRGIPQEVLLWTREGMPRRCVANLDNVHTVQKTTLRTLAGRLAPARVREVKRALGHALGWAELA